MALMTTGITGSMMGERDGNGDGGGKGERDGDHNGAEDDDDLAGEGAESLVVGLFDTASESRSPSSSGNSTTAGLTGSMTLICENETISAAMAPHAKLGSVDAVAHTLAAECDEMAGDEMTALTAEVCHKFNTQVSYSYLNVHSRPRHRCKPHCTAQSREDDRRRQRRRRLYRRRWSDLRFRH